MNYKNKILLDLLRAEGEDEVQSIIRNCDFLSNDSNWVPYGGNKGNFSTFENQQPESVASLIEKITNSIDSLLLKECQLRGIQPNSDRAPKTLKEALELFFNIPNGEIEKLESSKKTNFAKNIQIVNTGEKEFPDILIFDDGEGQYPEKFHKTFLSIGTSNKNDIQFVQGKYNMGSTGAVTFCGDKRYQLIISKRNDDLFKREKDKHKENFLGFTLVRRHILNDEEKINHKNSWYEYFCANGDKEKILSIPLDDEVTKEISKNLSYNVSFQSGAVIKLFSYQFPKVLSGVARGELYQRLNQLLYSPALPFTIEEKRKFFQKFNPLSVSGNKIRLSDDGDKVEDKIYMEINKKGIGRVEIDVISLAFKKDKKSFNKTIKDFIGKTPVIFTVNGQVHGHLGKKFISDCKLNYLKDSLLIHINCDGIDQNFRQDLFMANRSNIKETIKSDKLKEEIKYAVKSNERLQEINRERQRELISGGNSEDGKKIIEKMLSKNLASKELINLLKDRGNLNLKNSHRNTSNGNVKSTKKRENKRSQNKIKKTKMFPSIFKVNLKEKNGKKIKGIPLGGKGIISFETDVHKDYFFRPNDRGELTLEILNYGEDSKGSGTYKPPSRVDHLFDVSKTGPENHIIKVTFSPFNNLKVGSEIQVSAKLSRPEGDLKAIFYIRIDKQNTTGKDTKKISKDEGLDLPKTIRVKKDKGKWIKDNNEEWIEDNWDENSILKVFSNDDFIDAIAINIDSYVFERYKISQKANTSKKLEIALDQYITLVYSNCLFLYKSIENSNIKKDTDIPELVSSIFKTFGEAILYINPTEELLKYHGD